MKIAIALLALVGLVAAANIPTSDHKDLLYKQKFLFEIVYRMEDPLMFEEWIKLGKDFIVDKEYFAHFDFHMEKFYESFKMGALLPKGEFFGALAKTHHKQAWGLFNFFYYAKDWNTFMHNVCWARMHVNEGMFVYALTLAVIHRPDFEGLVLPQIYEIFPQHFFNSKFVFEAEKFDYEVFSKYIMYEKEYHDILYKDVANLPENKYFLTKDWKVWQWWKLMGLGEHWYTEDKYLLRENSDLHFNTDSKWLDTLKDVKKFWMPVDYTRDIDFFNDHSELTYFTEDLGWNSYWYYLNMDYAFFLDGKTFGLEKDRRGEYWLYNVQQLLSRYYLERLSNGFGSIPQFSWYHEIEYGYDPQLISYNGVGFSYRKNWYEFETYGNFDMLSHIHSFFKRISSIIDTGYYKTFDGTVIDFHKPEAIEFIGNYMQGNIDMFDKLFFQYWYVLSHMYISEVDYNDVEVFPNVFLNFETMLRDPMFYELYKKVTDVFYHFKYFLKPYVHEDLFFPGVTIKDVHVANLVTYFDFHDFDVTNLLNDKMIFEDGKFFWDKTLLARQMRLNHKPFHYEFTIESDKTHKVVIRTFLGPKFDEYGKIISLIENRKNFVQIDQFVYELTAGKNVFKRFSTDNNSTVSDRISYTEMYKYVMGAIDGQYEYSFDHYEPHCGFPERLLLPQGWEKGMAMQMFFFVTPFHAVHEQFSKNYDYGFSCGIGSGTRYIDDYAFGYPFDREIDEYEFFVPNMFFKDVEIFHEDKFEKYWEHKYEHFGTFDYAY